VQQTLWHSTGKRDYRITTAMDLAHETKN
jgi:hypothetical protein